MDAIFWCFRSFLFLWKWFFSYQTFWRDSSLLFVCGKFTGFLDILMNCEHFSEFSKLCVLLVSPPLWSIRLFLFNISFWIRLYFRFIIISFNTVQVKCLNEQDKHKEGCKHPWQIRSQIQGNEIEMLMLHLLEHHGFGKY